MWHPDIPFEYRNQIVTGDAKELAKCLPDKSIDLIFTDPVYDRIEDYEWLSSFAWRILKKNGVLLTFFGIGYLPETIGALMLNGMIYRWYIPHITPGTGGYCDTGPSRQMGMFWFDKTGMTVPNPRLYDVCFATKIKDFHIWRKNITEIIRWINSFKGIVLDPFCGGGTVPAACKILGRNYIAFEINPETAEIARERVCNTQPPLFVPEPEQLELNV